MSNTQRKEAFQHAIRCLAHPLSLLSMAILAFNDYYLRIHHPSWFTGKLGDVTWLFFFPFFLTAIAVWCLPNKWLKGNIPMLVGLGLTIFIFTLGKTWAPFLQGIIDLLEFFVPWQVGWVIDPTDLIGLPTLGLAYLLWVNQPAPRASRKLQLSWAWLGAAAVVLLADAGRPDPGLICVHIKDDDLYASSVYWDAKSYDGGLTWPELPVNYVDYNSFDYCDFDTVFTTEFEETRNTLIDISDPLNDEIIYRIYPDVKIERSADQGESWELEFEFISSSEVENRIFERQTKNSLRHNYIGPFDVVFDPQTNNLVMAMGYQGILVRETTGEYHWVDVGNYRHLEITPVQRFLMLLPGELFVALLIGGFCMGVVRWQDKRSALYYVAMISSIFTFGLNGILSPPVFNSAVEGIIDSYLPYLLLSLIDPILLIVDIAIQKKQVSFHLITFGISSFIAFSAYLLWAYELVHDYYVALIIGLCLCLVWTIFRFLQYKKLGSEAELAV